MATIASKSGTMDGSNNSTTNSNGNTTTTTSANGRKNNTWLEGTLNVLSTSLSQKPPTGQPPKRRLSLDAQQQQQQAAAMELETDHQEQLQHMRASFQQQKNLLNQQLQDALDQVEQLRRQQDKNNNSSNNITTNNTSVDWHEAIRTKTAENRRLQEELAQLCRVDKDCQQCRENTQTIQTLQEQLQTCQTQLAQQERYRRDEAEDLRILNDAQESQLQQLVKELEQAQEHRQKMQHELQQAQQGQQKAQLALETTRGETALCVADLKEQVTRLKQQKQQHEETNTNNTNDEQWKQTLAEAKDKLHKDYRRQIAQIRDRNQKQVAQLQTRLALQAGERPQEQAPSVEKQQSGGSVEEDLRKQLKSVKQLRDKLQSENTILRRNKDSEIASLKNKLEDRDTTISALVKSSVALEEQLSTAQLTQKQLQQDQQRGNVLDKNIDLVLAKNKYNKDDDSSSHEDYQNLQRRLEESRRTEQNFSNQVFQLRKQLQTTQEVNARLQEKLETTSAAADNNNNSSNNGSNAKHDKQLKERDEAISNLVKQSIAQDRLIEELREKLATTNQEIEIINVNRENTPSWEEVKQLRQEAEVFAGQVIELDEEIDSLRTVVAEKEKKIAELEQRQHAQQKPNEKDAKRILDLEAEIDELKEAQSTQQDELRLLRRKQHQQESYRDEMDEVQRKLQEANKKIQPLQEQVDKLKAEKDNLEVQRTADVTSHDAALQKLQEQLTVAQEGHLRSVQSLENKLAEKSAEDNSASSRKATVADEFEVQGLRDEIESLRKNLSVQTAAVDRATETIRELESMLAEKNSADAGAFEEEKEELFQEIESLTKRLDEAQGELKKQEEERAIIADFKGKLEDADEARETSERTIVDNYERKLSLLKLDKDVLIDKLRNQLVEEKEANAEKLADASTKIKAFESETEELREEMTAQLDQRETRIFALEHTLEAQEQLVKNMRIEMDHLQGSMESAASTRRGEVDELQQELVTLTATSQKQDREIKAMQMQLEQERLDHESEKRKLQETIESLEKQTSSEKRDAEDLKMEMRLQAVKDRLEKLSWRNTSLKDENVALRESLTKAEAQAKTSGPDEEVVELRQTIVVQEQAMEELRSELEMIKAPPSTIPMAKPSNAAPPSADKKPKSSPPRKFGGFLGRKR